MVAVISGESLGVSTSSANQVGSDGAAQLGRSRERVYVNVATGNLVIQGQDEYLASSGIDSAIVRTYNSQGQLIDDNGDNWQLNLNKRLLNLPVTPNSNGSSVTRRAGDGAETVFTYDVARGLYVSTDGDGPHDTLSYTFDSGTQSGVWTWTDGTPAVFEAYSDSGLLLKTQDAMGNSASYIYSTINNQLVLTQISDSSGQVINLEYADNPLSTASTLNLHSIVSQSTRYIVKAGDSWASIAKYLYGDNTLGGALQSALGSPALTEGLELDLNTLADPYTFNGAALRHDSRVSYDYDNLDRLAKVTVDLTPEDGSIADNNTYVTTYTYTGVSGADKYRIATITEGDGTSLSFTYDALGRVQSYTDGLGAVTSIDYTGAAAQASGSNTYQLISGNVPPNNGESVVDYPLDSTQLNTTENVPVDRPLNTTVLQTTQTVVQNQTATLNSSLLTIDATGGWTPTQLLEQDASLVSWPQVAFDAQGNGFATWVQGTKLYASRYENGAWGAPQIIYSSTYGPTYPQLKVSDSGQAVVVWSYGNIYANRYIPGSGWQGVEQVGASNLMGKVDIDNLGNVTVAWAQYDSADTYYHMRMNRYEVAAGGWQGVESLTEVSGAGSVQYMDIQVARDETGHSIVMWSQGIDTTSTSMYVSRYAGGAWSAASALESLSSSTTDPQVTFDAQGNGLAIWQQGGSLYGSRFESGVWSVAQLLENGSYSLNALSDPQLRMSESGYAVATWIQQDAVQGVSAWVNRYIPGSGWQGAELASTLAGAQWISADVDSVGNVSVAWGQYSPVDGYNHLTVNRYDVQGGWQGEQAVQELGTGSIAFVDLARDETGASTVLWAQNDAGGVRSLYGTRYTTQSPPYYVVQANDTWSTIAQSLYGTTAVADELELALRGALGTVPLQVGEQLSGFPGTLNSNDPLSYTIQTTDTWGSLALQFYGNAQAADALQAEAANQGITTLSAGAQLLLPLTLNAGATTQQNPNQIDVTDALGHVTSYTYDANGWLTKIQRPTLSGSGERPTTVYDYDANGNVTRITDAENRVTTYQYDERGNLLLQQDSLGNTVSYTYDDTNPNEIARNHRLTETRYTTPDPDITNVLNEASGAQTTRYVYEAPTSVDGDQDDHSLRFVISPEGRVTEYRYNGLGQRIASISYTRDKYNVSGAPSEADLANWVAGLLDKSYAQRTDYAYDFRGQLSRVTTYQAVDSVSGEGINSLGQPASVTRYIYDAAGQLLQTIDARGTSTTTTIGDYTTHYLYDGLGRVIQTTDALGVVTLSQYDDAGNRVTTELVNGLSTTSVYNARGDLIRVEQIDLSNPSTPISLGTTTYYYDVKGRLTHTINPTGVIQFYVYDNDDRQIAAIDGNGSITANVYDKTGKVIQSIAYEVPLSDIHQLINPLDQSPYAVTFDYQTLSVDPGTGTPLTLWSDTAGAANRINHYVYDDAHRLVYTIDALGYVSENRYNGEGQITDVIGYAEAIDVTGLSAQPSVIEMEGALAARANVATDNDRHSRNYYNGDGLLIGALDAEGYLSEYQYDAAGQRIETYRHATQISGIGSTATVTLDSLITSATVHVDDQHTYYLYNAQGQQTGSIDAEGYLTETQYDVVGNVNKTIRYSAKIDTSAYVPGVTTLDSVRPADGVLGLDANGQATVADHITVYEYDELNRLKTTTAYYQDTILHKGDETNYQYDSVGNRTATTASVGGTGENAERTLTARYDSQGRLIGSLTAEGRAALLALGTNPAPAQIDAIYAEYGTTYTYDAAGRRTSTTDQWGNTTYFFYNEDNQLRLSVREVANSAGELEGEVSEIQYNTFGQVSQTIRRAKRLSATDFASLKTVGSGLPNGYIVNVVPDSSDEITTTQYDVRGAVKAAIDGKNFRSEYSYNAFGELQTQRTQTGASGAGSNAISDWSTGANQPVAQYGSVLTTYTYDRRGQAIATTRDADNGGLNLTSQTQYDAFGRVRFSTDARLNSTEYRYDRLGQVVEVIDPAIPPGQAGRKTTYDAFARVLTQTDALGNTTKYSYDDVERSFTVTTPEGVTTKTILNAHGETFQVIVDPQGDNVVTQYDYDVNGNLTQVTEALGSRDAVITKVNHYDIGNQHNRLYQTKDANHYIVQYEYDAANRVQTRTLDPNGLNIRTQYEYDGIGRTITTRLIGDNTDPTTGAVVTETRVTQTIYDARGQVLDQIVDPDLGDPNATYLNIITRFTYDAQGNTLTVTTGADTADARTTQYVYDQLGRRTHQIVDPTTVHPTGELGLNLDTQYHFDANNNVIAKTDAAGNITRYVYDADNRLTYTVNAEGGVTFNEYDKAGNLIATTKYANELSNIDSLPVEITTTDLTINADPDRDQTTRYVYDQNNRLRYTLAVFSEIDSSGMRTSLAYVKESIYDNRDKVVSEVTYANAITVPAAVSLSAVKTAVAAQADAAQDRSTRNIYNDLEQLRYVIDALGYVTENRYDKNGQLQDVIHYAEKIDVPALPSRQQVELALQALSTDSRNQTDHYEYDAAGRLKESRDANLISEYYYYDAAGNKTYFKNKKGYTWTYTYDKANRTTAEITPAVDVTRLYQYNNGNSDPQDYVVQAGDTWESIANALYAPALSGNPLTAVANELSKALNNVILTTGATLTGLPKVLSVTAPEPITTQIDYDSLGNALSRTEAYGTSEERTTYYVYDKTGRQIQTILPQVAVYDANADQALNYQSANRTDFETTTAPTSITFYDAAGNAVANRDVAGNFSYKVYDQLGRVRFEIDAERYVTEHTYDAFGNPLTTTRYTNPIDQIEFANRGEYTLVDSANLTVSIPASLQLSDFIGAAGLIATYASNSATDRTITTVYDQLNRDSELLEPQVNSFDSSAPVGQQDILNTSPTTHKTYNAFGQLTEQSQLKNPNTNEWITTDFYYDQRGNRVAQVDAMGYLTTWEYDANGNQVNQTEYANALTPQQRAALTNAPYAQAVGWEAAVAVDSAGGNASKPEVLYAPDGTAYVSYLQDYNGVVALFVNAQANWGGNISPLSLDIGSVKDAKLAVDANGNLMAVWVQQTGTTYRVYASHMDALNGQWQAIPDLLSEGQIDTVVGSVQVQFDASGNAMAAWRQMVNGVNIVCSKYYDIVNGWQTQMDTVSIQTSKLQQLAFDAQGNAMAVWVQTEADGTQDIYANQYVKGTGWQKFSNGELAPIAVDQLAGEADSPQIAMDANGDAIIVWQQKDDGGIYHIYARRYTNAPIAAGGNWLDNWQAVETLDNGVASNSATPRVNIKAATDNNGNFVVVWAQEYQNNQYQIQARQYNRIAREWQRVEELESKVSSAGAPQFQFDYRGNAIAVWQSDASPYLLAAYYAVGAGWHSPVNIGATQPITGDAPQLAFDNNGNALVTWAQNDVSFTRIYAAKYNLASHDDRITTYEYDKLNRQTALTKMGVDYTRATYGSLAGFQDVNGDVTTRYDYDELGNLISTEDASGAITRTFYDALGRVTAVMEPTQSLNTPDSRAIPPFRVQNSWVGISSSYDPAIDSTDPGYAGPLFAGENHVSFDWNDISGLGDGELEVTINYVTLNAYDYLPSAQGGLYISTGSATSITFRNIPATRGEKGVNLSWSQFGLVDTLEGGIDHITGYSIRKKVNGEWVTLHSSTTGASQTEGPTLVWDKAPIKDTRVELKYRVVDPNQPQTWDSVWTWGASTDVNGGIIQNGGVYQLSLNGRPNDRYEFIVRYTHPGESEPYAVGTDTFTVTGSVDDGGTYVVGRVEESYLNVQAQSATYEWVNSTIGWGGENKVHLEWDSLDNFPGGNVRVTLNYVLYNNAGTKASSMPPQVFTAEQGRRGVDMAIVDTNTSLYPGLKQVTGILVEKELGAGSGRWVTVYQSQTQATQTLNRTSQYLPQLSYKKERLVLDGNTTGLIGVEIRDAAGNLVNPRTLSPLGNGLYEVDLSGLPRGDYTYTPILDPNATGTSPVTAQSFTVHSANTLGTDVVVQESLSYLGVEQEQPRIVYNNGYDWVGTSKVSLSWDNLQRWGDGPVSIEISYKQKNVSGIYKTGVDGKAIITKFSDTLSGLQAIAGYTHDFGLLDNSTPIAPSIEFNILEITNIKVTKQVGGQSGNMAVLFDGVSASTYRPRLEIANVPDAANPGQLSTAATLEFHYRQTVTDPYQLVIATYMGVPGWYSVSTISVTEGDYLYTLTENGSDTPIFPEKTISIQKGGEELPNIVSGGVNDVTPLTQQKYDAMGNMIVQQKFANGAKNPNLPSPYLTNFGKDQSIYIIYDGRGAAVTTIDAEGVTINSSYGLNGKIAREWYDISNADAQTGVRTTLHKYDRVGSEIATANVAESGTLETQNTEYNAFGEVSRKGIDNQWKESYQYDNNGRLITDSDLENSLITKVYKYNLQNQRTVDLNYGVQESQTKYDLLGHVIEMSTPTFSVDTTPDAIASDLEVQNAYVGINFSNDAPVAGVSGPVFANYNHVSLEWNDVSGLGDGELEVTVNYVTSIANGLIGGGIYYTTGGSTSITFSNILAAQGEKGLNLSWSQLGGSPNTLAGGVDHITGYTIRKKVNGEWVTLHNSTTGASQIEGPVLVWDKAPVEGTRVELKYRVVADPNQPPTWDSAWTWGVSSDVNGGIIQNGGVYQLSLNGRPNDRYEFMVSYIRPGESEPYAMGAGTFTVMSTADNSGTYMVGRVEESYLNVQAQSANYAWNPDTSAYEWGGENKVHLEWDSLDNFPGGRVRVTLNYVLYNNAGTKTSSMPPQVFTAEQGRRGVDMAIMDTNTSLYPGLKQVTGILVEKELGTGSGRWVKVYQSQTQATQTLNRTSQYLPQLSYKKERLVLDGNTTGLIGVEIRDANGNLVDPPQTFSEMGNSIYEVDLSGLPRGEYTYTPILDLNATGASPATPQSFTVHSVNTLGTNVVVQESLSYLGVEQEQPRLVYDNGYTWVGTNKVSLSWDNLQRWGDGPLTVEISYKQKNANGNYKTGVNGQLVITTFPATMSGLEAIAGYAHDFGLLDNSYPLFPSNEFNILEITNIKVSKQVGGQSGNMVTLFDGVATSAYRPRLEMANVLDAASPGQLSTAATLEFHFRQNNTDPYQKVNATYMGAPGCYSVSQDVAVGRYDYFITPVNSTVSLGSGSVDVLKGGVRVERLKDPKLISQLQLHPVMKQTVDRWGNVLSVVDPRSGSGQFSSDLVTYYKYNWMNQVVEEILPRTNITDEHGKQVTASPAIHHYYDALGREIGWVDGEGIITGKQYDNAGHLIKEYRGQKGISLDGGVEKLYYDTFGNMVQRVNANEHLTDYAYDRNNRLIQMMVESGTNSNPSFITTRYQYDEAGNRISQTLVAENPVDNETTKFFYDARGNVVMTRMAEGADDPNTRYYTAATYDYFGRKIYEENGNGDYQAMQYDYFGHLLSKRDFDGVVTDYYYNNLGQLETEQNSRGKKLFYEYYDNGELKRIVDIGARGETYFEYDAAGNKTRERFTDLGTNAPEQDVHITYDELNRILRVQDNLYDAKYQYDANGNRRNIVTDYYYANGQHQGTSGYWFSYDAMNRVLIGQGVLLGGVGGNIGIDHTAGQQQGQSFTYDKEGNRTTAQFYQTRYDENGKPIKDVNGKEVRDFIEEIYKFTGNNLVSTVENIKNGQANGLAWLREYDFAGRQIWYKGYSDLNDLTAVETRQTVYNKNGWVKQIITKDSVGTVKSVVSYIDPNVNDNVVLGYDAAGNPLGYTVRVETGYKQTITYTNQYKKYDSYKIKQVNVERVFDDSSISTTRGQTTYAYDANGNLVSVVDTEGPASDRLRTFVVNRSGVALRKVQGNSTQHYFYVGSNPVGSIEIVDKPSGPEVTAKFDFNYNPVTPEYPSATPGQYVVNEGDTLQAIAQTVYGDSYLWYIIADANGITDPAGQLHVGMTLIIPNNITNIHNNAQTYTPYNPAQIIGDSTPTLPEPEIYQKRLSAWQKIAVVVVAVIVYVVMMLLTRNPVIASMASEYARQGMEKEFGVREHYDGRRIAAAGLAAAFGAAIGVSEANAATEAAEGASASAGAASTAESAGSSAVEASVSQELYSQVVSQGVGMAMGVQDRFDWRSFAASVIVASVAPGAGLGKGNPLDKNYVFDEAVKGAGRSLITSTIKLLIYKHGKPTFADVLADAFQSAAAAAIMAAQEKSDAEAKLQQFLALSPDQQMQYETDRLLNQLPPDVRNTDRAKAIVSMRNSCLTGTCSKSEMRMITDSYLELTGANAQERQQAINLLTDNHVLANDDNNSGLSNGSGMTILITQALGHGESSMFSPIARPLMKTGEVFQAIGQFEENNPIVKYSLMGLDFASGPILFGVREAINASPIGEFKAGLENAAAKTIAGSLEKDGWNPTEGESAGIGGVGLLELAIGGAVAAAKVVGGFIRDRVSRVPNKTHSAMGPNDGPQLPSVFTNKFPEHPTDFPKLIADTKLSKGAGTYNYVVLEDGRLVVGRKFNSPGGGHIDLTNGNPVSAAGEVKIVHGEIKYIDNTSGHYEPFGIKAQKAAETAFSQRGFDVTGKYIEKVWVPNPKLPGKGSWRPINELGN